MNYYKKLVPVSPKEHRDMHWMPCHDLNFASESQILPLCLGEMTQAAAHLPFAIIKQGEHFTPVMITSLIPEQNHYINLNGQCVENYVPLVLRGYPFARVLNKSTDQTVLCIDEGYGAVVEPDTPDSEPFFDDEGKVAPKVQKIMQLLEQIENDRKTGYQACSILNKHNLLKEWPIQVRVGAGEVQTLSGLLQVDNEALNKLSTESFGELQSYFAIVVAYTQLVSFHQLPRLHALAQARYQQDQAGQGFDFLQEDDMIRFS